MGYRSDFNNLARLSNALFGSSGPTSVLRDVGRMTRDVNGFGNAMDRASQNLNRGDIRGITNSVQHTQRALSRAERAAERAGEIVTPDDRLPQRERQYRQPDHQRQEYQRQPQDYQRQATYQTHNAPPDDQRMRAEPLQTEPYRSVEKPIQHQPFIPQTPMAHATPIERPMTHTAQPDALSVQDTMALQAGLRLMNINAGPIDGDGGLMTQVGIDAYLNRNHLNISPHDHQAVLAAVRQDMRNDPDIQTRMADIVASGPGADIQDAKAVQAVLNDTHKAGLEIDGHIGGLTRTAFAGYMSQSYNASADETIPAPQARTDAPPDQTNQTYVPPTFRPGFGTIT